MSIGDNSYILRRIRSTFGDHLTRLKPVYMEQNDSLAKRKDEYFRIEDLPIGVSKCIFSDMIGIRI